MWTAQHQTFFINLEQVDNRSFLVKKLLSSEEMHIFTPGYAAVYVTHAVNGQTQLPLSSFVNSVNIGLDATLYLQTVETICTKLVDKKS